MFSATYLHLRVAVDVIYLRVVIPVTVLLYCLGDPFPGGVPSIVSTSLTIPSTSKVGLRSLEENAVLSAADSNLLQGIDVFNFRVVIPVSMLFSSKSNPLPSCSSNSGPTRGFHTIRAFASARWPGMGVWGLEENAVFRATNFHLRCPVNVFCL